MNFQNRNLVGIYGAVGDYADIINGTYHISIEMSNGGPIYVKDHHSDIIIEYWFSHSAWQIKFLSAKGKDVPIAYISSPSPLPLDLVAEAKDFFWRVKDKASWTEQADIRVILPPVNDVSIVGADGTFANLINGKYSPQFIGDKYESVYRKSGCDTYIEYSPEEERWCVMDRGEEGLEVIATVTSPLPLPLEIIDRPWETKCGNGWEALTGVAVVVIAIHTIRICGATGDNADDINGTYQPASEVVNGGSLYLRHDMCIEYWPVSRQWQLKRLSDRGTDTCLAFLSSPTAIPIHSIHKRSGGGMQWKVSVGASMQSQELIVAGREGMFVHPIVD